MRPLVLTMTASPAQRLDMARVVPHLLAGKSAAEIARIELQTTRETVTVGDVFRIRMGEAEKIRIAGGSERLDRVGCEMTGGEIAVEGDVGAQAGRLMAGGRLVIGGDAGPWAASRMSGGVIEIGGRASERLGGPLPGETIGMKGGIAVVRGDAGERTGDRMRGGLILVENRAGPYSGSRMIAGTLIVRKRAAAFPGYLMQRGTLVLGEGCDRLSPTFLDCGVHDLLALRLIGAFVHRFSPQLSRLLQRPSRRFAGDVAVLGKGEIFCPPG